MPRVIITRGALTGLARCRKFLEHRTPIAARRSGEIVADYIGKLERDSLIGRPDEEDPELQELVIPFGATGYVALSLPICSGR